MVGLLEDCLEKNFNASGLNYLCLEEYPWITTLYLELVEDSGIVTHNFLFAQKR